MKLIFLGPPGAGKGTMAARAKEAYTIPHISSGQLFRENVDNGTPLGLRVKAILDRGDLVPDEITVEMVQERLGRDDADRGFILDGFPRTVPQAEALEWIVSVDHVVNFTCPEKVVIERLTGRRQCRSCGTIYHITFRPPKKEGICDVEGDALYTRDDDTLEAVRNRLRVYERQTEPLIAWYAQRELLREIDAAGDADAVWEAADAVIRG